MNKQGMNVKFNLCILMFFISFSDITAQSHSSIDRDLSALFVLEEKNTKNNENITTPFDKAVKEIDIIFSVWFLLYKKLISSQDNRSCIYFPSCSEYAVESIKEKGLILGWLESSDRLSRCNGLLDKSQYEFNETTKLFYDPVK